MVKTAAANGVTVVKNGNMTICVTWLCGGSASGEFPGVDARTVFAISRRVCVNSSFPRQSGPLAVPTSDVEFQSDFPLPTPFLSFPFRPHPHSSFWSTDRSLGSLWHRSGEAKCFLSLHHVFVYTPRAPVLGAEQRSIATGGSRQLDTTPVWSLSPLRDKWP